MKTAFSITAHCKMIIQVLEHSLGGTDDVRGEVILSLSTLPFQNEPTITGWYALNMEVSILFGYHIVLSFFKYQHQLLEKLRIVTLLISYGNIVSIQHIRTLM